GARDRRETSAARRVRAAKENLRYKMNFRLCLLLWCLTASLIANGGTIRVGAVQAKNRAINFHVSADDAFAGAEKNLTELEAIIDKAADAKVEALVFPEDTMGLLNWNAAHEQAAKDLVPKAVRLMLARMGAAATHHNMYVVVCSENFEPDGGFYNTSFFIGRDGKEIGRYHKVCPVYHD